ncbi:uncharacterized protein [Elaeis guineensis]|uniref:uncharacterized protein isoform X1 n=1 Tax=Elaeis guineensis var. tenera TaxID=51953 RepID=UPI003C6D6C0C
MCHPVHKVLPKGERMEAGNLKINSNRAQGNRCWGIKLLVSVLSSPSPYGGEMQELDSANHGWKKQWPSMTPEEEDLISRLHHLLGDRNGNINIQEHVMRISPLSDVLICFAITSTLCT